MEKEVGVRIKTAAFHTWRWAVCGFIIIICIGFLFGRDREVKELPLENTSLVIPDLSKLDFGERRQGETFDWGLTVRNIGRHEINVISFETSCDCAKITPQTFRLQPGDSKDLKLMLSPDFSLSDDGRYLSRPISIAARIEGRTKVQPVGVLRGYAAQFAKVIPPIVTWREPVIKGIRTLPERVRVVPRIRVADVLIETESGVTAHATREGDGFELAITLESLQSGKKNSKVNLKFRDEHKEVVGSSTVGVAAFVSEPIIAMPAIVHGGLLYAGDPFETDIEMRCLLPGRKFQVLSWSLTDDVTVYVVDFDSNRYRLRWNPLGRGEQRRSIRIEADIENYGRASATIDLFAYGRAR